MQNKEQIQIIEQQIAVARLCKQAMTVVRKGNRSELWTVAAAKEQEFETEIKDLEAQLEAAKKGKNKQQSLAA